MVSPGRPKLACGPGDAGFTLVELLLALVVSIGVIGGATVLASRMQGAYRAQFDAATAQQEGRYVVQEIERYLRAAGNNPYRVETSACPVAGTTVMAIRPDPDGDGAHDDVRLQMDASPTNGLVGGGPGNCDEPNEDVTIAHDPATNRVTVTDNNLGGGPRALSDAAITGLQFVYRNPNRVVTNSAPNIAFVETRVTVQSRSADVNLRTAAIYTVSSEVRLRSR